MSSIKSSASTRFGPLARCFFLTRALEAIWIVAAVTVALAAENAATSPDNGRWTYWSGYSSISAGVAVITWYYLGFCYLPFSALFVFVSARYWRAFSALRYGAINASAFLLHSVAVIMLAFGGHLSMAMWTAWIATLAYNIVVPFLLWRLVVARVNCS
jgi:hypothetical protein